MKASFLPPPQHVAGPRTNTKKTISNNHWPLPRSPQPPVARPEKHALRTLRRDRVGKRLLALDGAQDPVCAAPLVNICAYGTLINELRRRYLLILNFLVTLEMRCLLRRRWGPKHKESSSRAFLVQGWRRSSDLLLEPVSWEVPTAPGSTSSSLLLSRNKRRR